MNGPYSQTGLICTRPPRPVSTAKVTNARPTDFRANFGHTGVPVTELSGVPAGRNCVWV
jgi:hypothetical protein